MASKCIQGDRGSARPGKGDITDIRDFGRGDRGGLSPSGVIAPDLRDFGEASGLGEVGVGSRSRTLVDQRLLMSSVSAIELRGSMKLFDGME